MVSSHRGIEAPARARRISLQSIAAVALLVTALISMLVGSVVVERINKGQRDRLSNEIQPALAAADQLEASATRLSLEARGYALSTDAAARARYEEAKLEYLARLEAFTQWLRAARRSTEAAAVRASAETYAAISDSIVAAADRRDRVEAGRLAAVAGPPQFDDLVDRLDSLQQQLDNDREDVADNIDTTENSGLIVILAAGGLGLAISIALLWSTKRNRRLTMLVEDQRQRLTDLVDNVPGIVWEMAGRPNSREATLSYVSDYATTMLGYDAADWEGTPDAWMAAVHPQDRRRAAEEAADIFAGRDGGMLEMRWVASGGRVVDTRAYVSVVKDEQDRPVGLRGVTIDVTEQKRAQDVQQLMANASSVLFSSFDTTQALSAVARMTVPAFGDWCIIHLLDESGRAQVVAVANADPERMELAERMMRKYPYAERGAPLVLRTGRTDMVAEILPEMIERIAQDGEHLELLRRIGFRSYICAPMTARGRILGSITLLSAESGRRFEEHDIAVAEDLGLRCAVAVDNARLYWEAERERARFASIISSVQHGVYQVDAAGRVVYVNPAAERLLGVKQADIAGRPLHEVVHPDHLAENGQCQLPAVARGDGPPLWIERFCRGDGAWIDVEVSSTPIAVAGGIVGAAGVFQDISERLQQEQMKEDFLAFASHELRSPLTTVSGFARWLNRKVQADPDAFDSETREAVELTNSGADRMAGIVDMFLDLTRIDAGRLTFEMDHVDFGDLLTEQCDGAQAAHPEAQITFTTKERPLAGISDGDRLRQVVANLLENAVKYGGNPPVVSITLERDGDDAVIRVQDNGRGIPLEDQPHVFDRFYQGSSGPRRAGLGIGLFVSKQVLEKLGGQISFVSAPGAGTEFTVRVPLGGVDTDGPAVRPPVRVPS